MSHLLRTLAALRDRDPRPFEASIVGPEVVEGLVASLTRERDALGLTERVRFEGKVPFPRLKEAVRTAELGLFPSEYESFGLSVVEAMATGVPSVLNDIRAFRYFVDHGQNGWIADFSKPAEAAATIAAARDLGERYATVSAAARTTARRYGWDQVVGDVEALYAAALDRASHAS
jgi:glycosyltransferase involved in cell wall biosynthesis